MNSHKGSARIVVGFSSLRRLVVGSVVSILLTGFVSQAFAGVSRRLSDGSSPEDGSFTLKQRDPLLAAPELQQVLSVINETNAILGSLARPRRVPLMISRAQARFVYSKGILHIGWTYAKAGWRAPFERIRAAIAHEWAHAVFDVNMRSMSSEWRSLSDWSHAGELGSLPRGTADSTRALLILSRPYNEFFADLVAALWADDSEAMTKALIQEHEHTGELVSRDPEGLRSFASRIEVAGWSPSGRFKTRIYRIFAPARSFLGRKLAWPLGPQEKAKLVEAAMRAIAAEFAWVTRRPNEAQAASPELLNRRLIAALESELQSHDLGQRLETR